MSTVVVYQRSFYCRESKEVASFLAALLASLCLGLGALSLALLPPLRALMRRLVRAPGEGPSAAGLAAGRFRLDFFAAPVS